MKNLYLLCVLTFFFVNLDAQIVATTTDGRRVILYANGSWRYAERNNNPGSSTDAVTLYTEAYKYAYEIIYANEFFDTERRNKSIDWAKDYVSKNLYIPIGSHSLEQWFNELYDLADNKLFSNIIFSPDRKKSAILWVEQILKDKAYFENYNLSIIDRHRMAYEVAYRYIYEQEFFDLDRKRKALQWANDFVRR